MKRHVTRPFALAFLAAIPCGQAPWHVNQVFASDGRSGDAFGLTVAVDGTTAVVMAGGAEAAYVLERDDRGSPGDPTDDAWVEIDKLREGTSLASVRALSLAGDTLVLGATGSGFGQAFVYQRDDNGTPLDRLDDSFVRTFTLLPDNAGPGEFGTSVDLQPDTITVGASWERNSTMGPAFGAVYVFERDEQGTPANRMDDTWVQTAKLFASDRQHAAFFGQSVAFTGDTIVAGARRGFVTGDNIGSAYVFERDDRGTPGNRMDDTWTETKKLMAADPDYRDDFGKAVTLTSTTILVQSVNDDELATNAGAVYFFARDDRGTPGDPTDDDWPQLQKIEGGDTARYDGFGTSVSISGSHFLAGAFKDDDSGVSSGSAYLFTRDDMGTSNDPLDDRWQQVAKLTANDADAGDEFGWSLELDGGTAVVGAVQDDVGTATNQGSAHIFTRLSGPSFSATPATLSLAAGGVQTMSLDAGSAFAGDVYVVAGDLGLPTPGFVFQGYLLPLAPDGYFNMTVSKPNMPPLSSTLGVLDAQGQATAGFVLPPSSMGALAGTNLRHLFVAFELAPFATSFVSDPALLTLVP